MAAQVSECAHCGTELYEGSTFLYDDYRDIHFCCDGCFEDWFIENTQKLMSEYGALNIHSVDV